ncbi:MAG TPA: head-tail connector protein, partial [Chitinophagaceae bacterium]|nr:head-tail connector protein [Chitinophagaceae bacterium]
MNGVIDIKFTDEGTTEPVLLADVKAPLEIDGTYHDAFLTDLIATARQVAEKYLNRSLIPRTVEATIMNESGGQLLPYGIPSGDITVKDAAGGT